MTHAMIPSSRSAAPGTWQANKVSRRTFLRGVLVASGAVLTGAAAVEQAAAANKITLNQWYHQYGEKGTQQAVTRYAQEYTKANPDVQVKVNWVVGDYTTLLNTALVGGNPPDVFEYGTAPNLQMVKAGQIVPTDDFYPPDIKKDYSPTDLQSLTIDGHIYGVKIVDDTGVLYYRKSMLDKAGVKPPTNMDEVVSAAKTLTKGGVKGIFLGNDGGISSMLTILPWSAGVQFLNNNEVTFADQRTADTYAKLQQLNKDGSVLTGSPTDWFDPTAFTSGLCAMQWTGLWAMREVQQGVGDDYGVLAWPPFDAKGTPVTFLGGWAEEVSAKSKNIDAAKDYVKWLWITKTDIQKDFNLSYGFHVPPRLSLAASAEPLKSGPALAAVQIFHKDAKIMPPTWDNAMNVALTDAVTSIVKNNADPMTALKQAASKCQTELNTILK